MNNKERAQALIDRLNLSTIGTIDVHWNTPNAFMLESYQPGARRIYQICRNSDDTHGGQSTLFSGTAPEVYNYLRAMLEGMALATENAQ